jgi:N-acetylmuramoyl-L-alanine amidase
VILGLRGRGKHLRLAAYLSASVLVLAMAGFSLTAPNRSSSPPLPEATISGSLALGDRPDIVRSVPAEPAAPLRVALQAGHWRASEAPDELSGVRRNGGTRGGGKYEWEVNLEIAEMAAVLLEAEGYEVEVLPATVPVRYRADAFVAIHADGNNDSSVTGYRVGSPRRDATQQAGEFAEVLADAYGEVTGMYRLPVVTRRMRGYYAFRYNRYRHSLHPMTVGIIIETGFLTSPTDQRILIGDPALAARGIVEGVTRFLGPAEPAEDAPAEGATR